jgi:hypothetical protein
MTTCVLSTEAVEAIAKHITGVDESSKKQPCVILKCSKAESSIKVEDVMDDCDHSELAQEMDPANPRLIVWRYGVKIDAVKTVYHNCIVFFNPQDYAVEMKRMYETSLTTLANAMNPPMKIVEITDKKDIKESIVSSKIIGLRGAAASPWK